MKLTEAQTAPEMLRSIACILWERHDKKRRCPDKMIPSPDDLSAWWLENDPDPDGEAGARMAELFGKGPWLWRVFRPPTDEAFSSGNEHRFQSFGTDDRPAGDLPPGIPLAVLVPGLYLDEQSGEYRAPQGDGKFDALSLQRIHYFWRQLTAEPRLHHPLAPLVKAWQGRVLETEPDIKHNAIIPSRVGTVRDVRSVQGTLFNDLPDTARTGFAALQQWDLFGNLPGFEPRGSARVPSLPLMLFDAAGEPSAARGRGAPLALRVWIECLLFVPPADRKDRVRLAIPLRDFIAALWPNDSYRRRQDGARLMEALHRVHNARVPWTDPETGRPAGYWAVAAVVNMPRLDDLNSSVVFEVGLPPGSASGPMVHRPTLRKYGVASAPAYRSALGLAYLWNRHFTHKGKRLPPTVPVVERNARGIVLDAQGRPLTAKGGRPVTHWNDARAVRTGEYERNPELDRRLPWLEPEELLALAFPEAARTTRQARAHALRRAREILRMMADEGDLVIVEDGPRWRLEPPDWWGAPGGNTTHKRPTGGARNRLTPSA